MAETQQATAETLAGLQRGRIVVHRDFEGVERAAMLTDIVDPVTGLVNLVAFGRRGGDAPATLELNVRFRKDPQVRFECWDWPPGHKERQK